ncbi:hypothetical protein F4824DRAFT_377872 [Ustulina deusta]|nr:hypothetical protein F4824DRAFT_377872 [Ustulina deusta]
MLSDDRPAYFHRYSAKIFRSRDEYRVSSFYTKIIATYNSHRIPLQWLASTLHLFPYALVFNGRRNDWSEMNGSFYVALFFFFFFLQHQIRAPNSKTPCSYLHVSTPVTLHKVLLSTYSWLQAPLWPPLSRPRSERGKSEKWAKGAPADVRSFRSTRDRAKVMAEFSSLLI